MQHSAQVTAQLPNRTNKSFVAHHATGCVTKLRGQDRQICEDARDILAIFSYLLRENNDNPTCLNDDCAAAKKNRI